MDPAAAPGSSAGQEEQRARLALWRIPGIGPRRYTRLLKHFGSAADVLSAPSSGLSSMRIGGRVLAALQKPDWSAVDRDVDWLSRPRNHLLSSDSASYPPLLREIDSPPPLLFIHGDPALLSEPQLAVVGSRNPTPGGRDAARGFAGHLGRCGLVITSGLALGIDAAGHEGALDAGCATVAVLGTGPDRVYPARHNRLAHRIAECGALVSEFPPGTAAAAKHFPRRNRIIAGLSVGTLVVEAALRSGSLITARLAAAQGREVFAMPGSIHNPLCRGCHALIREGAKLVESADHILEELTNLVNGIYQQVEIPLPVADVSATAADPAYQSLLEQMGHDPVSVDQLVVTTQLTAAELSSMLLIMEMQGQVEALAGGRYLRKGLANR